MQPLFDGRDDGPSLRVLPQKLDRSRHIQLWQAGLLSKVMH